MRECIQFRFQLHLFWTVFLIVSGFFLLDGPVSLNSGFGACDCGSSEINFHLSHADNLPHSGTSSQPHGNRDTECGS
jgi:hypothetical protein